MKDEEEKNNSDINIEKTDDPQGEDDVVEFVFNDDGEEDLKATLKKLRKDLKQAQKDGNGFWIKEIDESELAAYKESAEVCPVNVIHIYDKETGEKII